MTATGLPHIAVTVQVENPELPTVGDPLDNLRRIIALTTDRNIPVTWFVDARWATAHPDLCAELAATGGTIGLNTSNSLPTTRNATIRDGLEAALDHLQPMFPEQRITLARVPFRLGPEDGELAAALDDLGLLPVSWTHASRDWDPAYDDASSLALASGAVPNGGVVLFHSWPDRTASLIESLASEPSAVFGPLHAEGHAGVVDGGPRVTTDWTSPKGHSFRVHYFRDATNEVVVLTLGDLRSAPRTLARMHSACLTSEVLASTRCDCREQLHGAIDAIGERGTGALLYFVSHEGRGIGLEAKLRAYALQDSGLDTTEANQALGLDVDKRDYSLAPRIFEALGVERIELITNNPLKQQFLIDAGFDVERVDAWSSAASPYADAYVDHKIASMGHHDQER